MDTPDHQSELVPDLLLPVELLSMRLSLRQVQTEVHGLEQQEELGLAVRVVSKSKGKGHKHKSTRAENHSVLEVKLQIVTKL